MSEHGAQERKLKGQGKRSSSQHLQRSRRSNKASKGAKADEKNAYEYSYAKLFLFLFLSVLVLIALPIGRFFIQGLTIVPHELGHVITSWVLGSPSAPILSTMGFYTVTMSGIAWIWFKVLTFGLWCYFIYHWAHLGKRQGLSFLNILFLIALLLLTFIPQLQSVFVESMGTGTEIIAACLFCYFALSPYCKTKRWKRYVFLFFGVALYLNVFVFLGQLCFDTAYLDAYLQGSGAESNITNDLVKIQEATHLPIKAQVVILGLLAIFSLRVLWRLCHTPYNYFGKFWDQFKQIPVVIKFMELRSKSRKIF